MVTKKAAHAQIKRLAVYGDYRRLRDDKVLEELENALISSGNTDERAERIVDAILAEPEREFCPKPGEIQAVARNTSDRPEPATRWEGCSKCDGTGWVIVEIAEKRHGLLGGATTAAAVCECRKAATA